MFETQDNFLKFLSCAALLLLLLGLVQDVLYIYIYIYTNTIILN
jgi:hypothetical protein